MGSTTSLVSLIERVYGMLLFIPSDPINANAQSAPPIGMNGQILWGSISDLPDDKGVTNFWWRRWSAQVFCH